MKQRIDLLASEKLNLARNKVKELILNERLMVNGKVVLKPSFLCDQDDIISLKEEQIYVSRAAHKLIGAIASFKLDFSDKIVLDMGASTGGFTQVALLNGAKKVYAVDVGRGELDKELAKNEKVVNLEQQDIRTLNKALVPDCDIVIGDLSFISLTKVLPKIKELYGNKECVLLFKPQFECGRESARMHKGVINDKAEHKRALLAFVEFCNSIGFKVCDIAHSPIKGKKGNIEYLVHLNASKSLVFNVDDIVLKAFNN